MDGISITHILFKDREEAWYHILINNSENSCIKNILDIRNRSYNLENI